MIESKKVSQQITEYVLDLLSPPERKQVEENAAQNKAYQKMLQRERQVGQLVRTTLQQSTTPDAKRLRELMPAIPQQKRPFNFFMVGWQKQFVAIAVLAVFFLSSFSIYQSQQSPIYDGTPTLMAATATFTNEPTATTAQEQEEEELVTSTAVAIQPQPEKVATPAPSGTPIAALPPLTN